MTRVTVITPSYNQGRFIGETIESVLSQDYPNIEYWVIDGGSTDETLDVLRGFGQRIRWISEKDRGQSDAINKGMRAATGEIVTWLCSDDLYRPGAVRRGVEAFQRHPDAGVVYGDADYVDPAGGKLLTFVGWPFDLSHTVLSCRNPISQAAAFIRSEIWHRVGGVREDLPALMDLDLWLRVGLLVPLRYVPEVWAAARMHPASKSIGGGAVNAVSVVRIISDFLGREDCPPQLTARRHEALASAHVVAAAESYQACAMGDVRRHLRAAQRYHPPRVGFPEWTVFLRSCLGANLVRTLRRLRGRRGHPLRRITDAA
jgi:GT2 family glycosyltransferase